jgi:putative membrane protein
MMHYFYGDLFGFGGTFMTILFLLLVILIVWAISGAGRRHYFYDNYQNRDERRPGSRGTGLDVLNERYAKGEITKEEYEQKKKDILS